MTRPGLELELIELIESGGSFTNSGMPVGTLIDQLEEFQGSQLQAAAGAGKWVIPWVGGWERAYANGPDARYLGGPQQPVFSFQGRTYQQVSQRQFVYGPGESGVTVEYLYAVPGAPASSPKLLFTRPATVSNLGGLEFTFGFEGQLNGFEVLPNVQSRSDTRGVEYGDGLKTGVPIEGGGEREAPMTARLKTTYLSERVWIIRDWKDPSQLSIFLRTETRSVADRRGLVAEGQVKPPDSDEVRFGGLLFGETIQEYANWDKKVAAEEASKSKLLVR